MNFSQIFKRLNMDREDRILLDCHVDRVLNYMTEATNFKKLDHYQVIKIYITLCIRFETFKYCKR